jgi:hypothetical protein
VILVTNQWDEELVDQTFWLLDAFMIKSIPTPSHDKKNVMVDFFAWNLTNNGIFTVWSYYAEWESNFGNRLNMDQGPGSMNSHPMWEIIRELKVVCKVKNLYLENY